MLRFFIVDKIKSILRIFNLQINKLGKVSPLESLFWRYYHNDFFILQIGANDGVTADPLNRIIKPLKQIKGVLIETVKEYYDELNFTYRKHRNLKTVNAAIFSKTGYVKIYKPINYENRGIASVIKDHHKKSNYDSKNIQEIKCQSLTYKNLFSNYKIKSIDLLLVDAEGYDYDLIKMFPFDQFKPSVIQYEHGNIEKKHQLEIITILIGLNYKVFVEEFDTIAYL